MQQWNISRYRAQRVDEKNDVVRLVMFTSKVMAIIMSKMAYLMYFLLNTEKKKTDPVWARYLNASERLFASGYIMHLLFFILFLFWCSTHNISRTVASKAY